MGGKGGKKRGEGKNPSVAPTQRTAPELPH